MNLETPTQRIIVLGILLGFLAVLAIALSWVLSSLSDANMSSLGHWLNQHSAAAWGFLIGAVPSIATYLFGRRAGRKAGKTEAYSSAITAVKAAQQPREAAELLSKEAEDHGLRVSVAS
jgi:hypothetical protein